MAVLNDCKYGWDKPSDNCIRQTLIHTPIGEEDLDLGMNEFTWSLYPHKGCWRAGEVVHQAARLNQPLLAVQTGRHEGTRGRSLSLLDAEPDRVGLMALKKAERGDRVIIRVRELDGSRPTGSGADPAAEDSRRLGSQRPGGCEREGQFRRKQTEIRYRWLLGQGIRC